MIVSASLALALLASPEVTAQSVFTDPGHVHEWTEMERDESGSIAVDAAYRDAMMINGVEYPVALIRMSLGEESNPATPPDRNVSEVLSAVDCDNVRVANLEMWLSNPPDGEPARRLMGDQDFHSVANLPEEGRQILFRTMCGTDWQDKAE